MNCHVLAVLGGLTLVLRVLVDLTSLPGPALSSVCPFQMESAVPIYLPLCFFLILS